MLDQKELEVRMRRDDPVQRRRSAAGRPTARRRYAADPKPAGRRRSVPAIGPRAREQRAAGERRLPGFDVARLGALGLSRRELGVLELVAQGHTNEQIASSLRLSPLTVKKHLERMYAKLGVANRASLVAVAWQRSRPGGLA